MRQTSTTTTAALALVGWSVGGLAGCGHPIAVDFILHAKGERVACADTFSVDGVDTQLVDARFFVSQMVLLDSGDSYNQLRFDADGTWQDDDVALLDFEDGAGLCDRGTPETHMTLTGETRAPDIVELSFLLGVPPSLNLSDPTQQDAPIDLVDMHAGSEGNLHASIALLREESPWTAQLFSTGCDFDSKGADCDRDNIARVSIPYEEGLAVVLDLDVLMIGTGPPGDDNSAGCESDPTQSGCVGMYQSLGLDLESGNAVAPAVVFSTE